MDKHQKTLIAEDHTVIAKALLEWHQIMERSALLKMKPKKEQIEQLKKIIDDMKKQLAKAGPWTKSVFKDEIRKMEHQLELVMAEGLEEGVPRYAKNMKGVQGVGKKGTGPKTIKWSYVDARGVKKTGTLEKTSEGQGTDVTYFFRGDDGKLDVVSGSRLKKAKRLNEAVTKLKKGQRVLIQSPDYPEYHGRYGFVKRADNKKQAATIEMRDRQIVSFMYDELTLENVSVGAGTIPTGPESVGVKPDFKFRGHAGFDCDANTFSKCIKGKKKHKRWNTFLNRDDELVGKVKAYMGQSYKNTNFVLRNTATGEMVMGRRVS